MHKIEPHLHTTHVSKCGWLDAKTIAERYKAAGYSAVIVTDHYNRCTFNYLGVNLHSNENKLERFLEGYDRLCEEGAKVGLTVYRGAELRFDECDNDYLLYGYDDDLLSEPEDVFRMGIAAFSPIARGRGALIIQAHPYRKGCTPAIARYLDGIEVYNCNPRHKNRNERALEYAQEFGLIGTAGSDCHREEDIAISGILVPKLPSDSMGMMRLIRTRSFELIVPEEK